MRTFICILAMCFSLDLLAVEKCADVYKDAMVTLNNIQGKLETVQTKKDYEESVKARFDRVEALLIATEGCEKPPQMEARFLQDWQQMYMTLTALQASAQLSAFSEFNNWLESKEQDLLAFEYAKNANWK